MLESPCRWIAAGWDSAETLLPWVRGGAETEPPFS